MARPFRNRMSEAEMRERKAEKLAEQARIGDQLVEKWSKSEQFLGEDVVAKGTGNESRLVGLYNKDARKARNWAIMLENTQNHIQQRLQEYQTSQTISGVTPNHVLKVISYAYPNFVRGDIFHEWGMTTTKDSLYFLTRKWGKTARGVTSGDNIINTQTDGRAISEIEVLNPDEAVDGTETTFTKTLAPTRIVEKKVFVFLDGVPVAYDDGAGSLVPVVSDGANATVSSGTIDYATGDFSVTFATAPSAGLEIAINFNFDSEEATNFDQAMSLELGLSEQRFEPRPHTVYLNWSQMLQWKFGSTIDVDAEAQFIAAAGDGLRANADSYALARGYSFAKQFVKIPYEASFGGAGADDAGVYANTFTRAIKGVEKSMYDAMNKGGVDVIYGSAKIVGYLEQSTKWQAAMSPSRIGPYLAGTFNGIPVYQAEGVSGMPEDEAVVIYKNPNDPDDAYLSFGVFLPMVMTPKIQYQNFSNEIGVTSVYDDKKINDYARIIKFNNLDVI